MKFSLNLLWLRQDYVTYSQTLGKAAAMGGDDERARAKQTKQNDPTSTSGDEENRNRIRKDY